MSRRSTKQRRAGRRRRTWVFMVQEGRRLHAEMAGRATGLLALAFRRPPTPAEAICLYLSSLIMASIATPARRWYELKIEATSDQTGTVEIHTS